MASPADRFRERLDHEEPLLIEAFPDAAILRKHNVVVLSDYLLPPGWSHSTTDVLIVIPANYPAGCPDNVCARPDLRLADGRMPANNQGIQTHAGRQWLQFSWHINGSAWRPTADPKRGNNLVTYMLGSLTRFEEVS